jgi:hypothetical protein
MIIWLVVWNIFYFPIDWECPHPNWVIFFRGVETTNQLWLTTINHFPHVRQTANHHFCWFCGYPNYIPMVAGSYGRLPHMPNISVGFGLSKDNVPPNDVVNHHFRSVFRIWNCHFHWFSMGFIHPSFSPWICINWSLPFLPSESHPGWVSLRRGHALDYERWAKEIGEGGDAWSYRWGFSGWGGQFFMAITYNYRI